MAIFEELKNKTAIITGGAQGIGKGIAKALVDQGVNVVIADIQEEKGQELATLLGGKAFFHKTDLTQENDIRDLVSCAANRYNSVDFVINNARPPLMKSSPQNSVQDSLLDDWDTGIDVLLKAPCLLVKYALPFLLKAKAPAVINIASTNALFIAPQPLVYHVAKAGLIQMTRYTAYVLGQHGIRVNCVAPGVVDIHDQKTPLTHWPINKKTIEIACPLKRAALVEEIADSVLFLCSDSSSYVNGQVLFLDGGITLGDQFHVTRHALNASGCYEKN